MYLTPTDELEDGEMVSLVVKLSKAVDLENNCYVSQGHVMISLKWQVLLFLAAQTVTVGLMLL